MHIKPQSKIKIQHTHILGKKKKKLVLIYTAGPSMNVTLPWHVRISNNPFALQI